MKRIIICSVLLLFGAALSIYAYMRVERVNEDMNIRIDAMIAALDKEDRRELAIQAEHFKNFWDEEEDMLVHLVRHSHIDVITISVTRLPSLAKYGDFGELSAELEVIRRQMEHIRESERFSFDNLL